MAQLPLFLGALAARLTNWLDNKTAENFARWINDAAAYNVVAEAEDRIAGFALVRQNALLLCYVSPSLVRTGVGCLLNAIEHQARGRGHSNGQAAGQRPRQS